MASLRGAANAVTRTITQYLPDPAGTAMFRGLADMQQAGVDGRTGLIYTGDPGSSPERTFGGDLGATPQRFLGSGLGHATPIAGKAATVDTTEGAGALANPARQLLAARAARQGMGIS